MLYKYNVINLLVVFIWIAIMYSQQMARNFHHLSI
jgi:hypothetical protein